VRRRNIVVQYVVLHRNVYLLTAITYRRFHVFTNAPCLVSQPRFCGKRSDDISWSCTSLFCSNVVATPKRRAAIHDWQSSGDDACANRAM
jgi:hypothetical protein